MLATVASNTANDAVCSTALFYYAHQAIWAYEFAASYLSATEVELAAKSLRLLP
jgi:hypothetical protein